MSDESLKVGVVGVGHLGRIHARIYRDMEKFDLVGVVDSDGEVAGRVAQEFGCQAFDTCNDLLNCVDAVSIVVPTSSHADVAVPCLLAGTPVLVEKPIAGSMEEAERINMAALSGSTPLLVGHLERFNPGLLELKKRLHRPVMIEVYRLNPFSERATDVDVVTDLMIHDLDIVTSLLGETPTNIIATGTRIITERTDVANVRAEYPGGTVVNFVASRVSMESRRRMRVYQGDGYLELDFSAQKLLVAQHQRASGGERYGRLEYTTISPVVMQPLEAELLHFHDVVMKGAEPRVSGDDGIAALRQVEWINQLIAPAPMPESG